MLQLTKILVPIDFSEQCVEAAHYAGMLACRFRSEVTMVHVVTKSEYPIALAEIAGVYQDWWTEAVTDAQRKLSCVLPEDFKGIPVKRLVLEGDPAIKIVELANSMGADLIVMPTHGYGPFRRFILGSVTAKVLHDADCSVLTGVHIENETKPAAAIRNILCAVDLGPQSERTLGWAAAMAAGTDARLHMLHVLPSPDVRQARYFDQDWRRAIEQAAKEQADELQQKTGTHADLIFNSEEVSKAVRNVAEFIQADLVVIGRHVGGGILGRLRTQSYAIIRESPCPVVSV